MSSRDDRRPRERSWERDNRDGDRRGRDRGRDRDRDRGGDRDKDRGGDRDRERERDRDRRKSDHRPRRRDSRSRSRSPRRDSRRDYERERSRERRGGRERPKDDRRGSERESRRGDSGRHGHDRDQVTERQAASTEVDKLKTETRRDTPSDHYAGATTQQAPANPEPAVGVDAEMGEPGEELELKEDQIEDANMMAMMGFGGFDSTKGKTVAGNQDGAVNVKKPRTWRQYMNRRGGFNRPLDKIK